MKQPYDYQLDVIAHEMDDLESHVRQRVTHEEFEPIKKIVYGMMALVLIIIITALVSIIISDEWWQPITRMFT